MPNVADVRTDAAFTSTVEVLLQLNSVTAVPSTNSFTPGLFDVTDPGHCALGLMIFNADTTATVALLLDIPTTGFRIRGRRLKVLNTSFANRIVDE